MEERVESKDPSLYFEIIRSFIFQCEWQTSLDYGDYEPTRWYSLETKEEIDRIEEEMKNDPTIQVGVRNSLEKYLICVTPQDMAYELLLCWINSFRLNLPEDLYHYSIGTTGPESFEELASIMSRFSNKWILDLSNICLTGGDFARVQMPDDNY